MVGKYACFAELARHEREGTDYRVRLAERARAATLIAAPHGGLIEDGTSDIAALIAGDEHHFFSFEGMKPYGRNRALHITSHRFDHPACLALAARSARVLTVHGCLGESAIHVGGLDEALCLRITDELLAAGFEVQFPSRRYPGRHRLNICNRGATGRGVQLEVTYDLRGPGGRPAAIAAAVRSALAGAAAADAPPMHESGGPRGP